MQLTPSLVQYQGCSDERVAVLVLAGMQIAKAIVGGGERVLVGFSRESRYAYGRKSLLLVMYRHS